MIGKVIFEILRGAWKYRFELALALKTLQSLWKTAREMTREYIRRRIKEKLKTQIAIIVSEIGFLILAYELDQHYQTLATELLASIVLWAITLFNLFELVFRTVPELIEVHRILKSKIGFTIKHILKISVVAELMQWNVIFLFLCLFLSLSSRTLFASAFSYFAPWVILFERIAV